MNRGLIVSIQGYSLQTTQELAEKAILGGAVAIRTDQPIKIPLHVIGLKKIYEKKYYMTNDPVEINNVMKYADYVAIDCRRGNDDLGLIISHCHVNGYKYIADIEKIEDYENLMNICEREKIITPSFVSTTFNVFNNNYHDDLITNLCKLTSNVIIEGGISETSEVFYYSRYRNVSNICIGTAISDIESLTNKFTKEYACYW